MNALNHKGYTCTRSIWKAKQNKKMYRNTQKLYRYVALHAHITCLFFVSKNMICMVNGSKSNTIKELLQKNCINNFKS